MQFLHERTPRWVRYQILKILTSHDPRDGRGTMASRIQDASMHWMPMQNESLRGAPAIIGLKRKPTWILLDAMFFKNEIYPLYSNSSSILWPDMWTVMLRTPCSSILPLSSHATCPAQDFLFFVWTFSLRWNLFGIQFPACGPPSQMTICFFWGGTHPLFFDKRHGVANWKSRVPLITSNRFCPKTSTNVQPPGTCWFHA